MEEWLANEDDEDDEEEAAPAMNLNSSDYEVSVVTEPLADLKEILNEQITLQIPMQPKPDKDDKGDCNKCGRSQLSYLANLSDQDAPLRENPFSVYFKKKKLGPYS